MAELKTKQTDASVAKFIKTVQDADRRADCEKIIALMKKVTKAEPKMWGPAIVGFGQIRLKYDSGRELDWMIVGFSPRKANLTLYALGGAEKPELMKRLGKYKTGKGCLYINKLSDVDFKVLEELVTQAVKEIKARNAKK